MAGSMLPGDRRFSHRFVVVDDLIDDHDLTILSNFVDVHIKNLRKKLKTNDEESLVKTVRGFGYVIEMIQK